MPIQIVYYFVGLCSASNNGQMRWLSKRSVQNKSPLPDSESNRPHRMHLISVRCLRWNLGENANLKNNLRLSVAPSNLSESRRLHRKCSWSTRMSPRFLYLPLKSSCFLKIFNINNPYCRLVLQFWFCASEFIKAVFFPLPFYGSWETSVSNAKFQSPNGTHQLIPVIR